MIVSLIAAMDRQGLIGDAHGLPWRLPRDLKRFRALTWGKPVIVGRTTHDLVGSLPGRHHIVLSRRPDPPRSGCPVAATFDEALRQAEAYLATSGGDEVMVIGGGQVYREALPRAERIYLTVVDSVFHGATYFPWQGLREGWHVVEEEDCPADEKNPLRHRFFRIEHGPGRPFDLRDVLLPELFDARS
jgi:dihydrofolate reductase